MSEAPVDTIVVQALVREFRLVRNKLNGSAGRLQFARDQVALEINLMNEYKRDLDMLAMVLVQNGGTIPPEDNPQ